MGSTNKTSTVAPETAVTQELAKVNSSVNTLEAKRKSLAKQYTEEKRITVQGAPMYQAHFGKAMPISLNGVYISVPLDGNRYEIPESFAMIFNERIRTVNEQLEAQKRMSNVTNNIERYAGELDLVKRV